MKNFTKKILTSGIIALTFAPLLGLAQTQAPQLPERTLDYNGILGVLSNVANLLFGLMSAVAVFYVLWAAWLYLQGEKVDDAKAKLWNAGIGLAIGLLAKILPKMIELLVRGSI